MIRVVIADDHPLVRDGIVAILEREGDLQVVAQAASGPEAVAMSGKHDPDVVLMDLRMPGGDGVDAIRRLRAGAGDRPRILVLTTYDTDHDIRAALNAGADGYLLKDMEPEQLIQQIRAALGGALVISPALTRVLAQALRNPPSASQLDLTDRERQVLKMIAAGSSNKVIGNKLGITEGTVKVHVKNLLHKLGLRSRVEAAVWAMEHMR